MFALKLIAILAGLGVLAALALFGKELVRLFREDLAYRNLSDTADLEARVEVRAAGYTAGREPICLGIGVWQRGRAWVRSFGNDRPAAGEVPAGAVLYEIGSVTKVFTGILLASAEVDGRLRLDDAIGGLLPPEAEAAASVRAITLKQLATHTSGLPRLPDNLDATIRDEANPYENYRAKDLHAYLRSARPRCRPGGKAAYSNLGAGLLGYLLAREAAMPFEALVGDAVLRPLGMNDTAVRLSGDQQLRLVPGRGPDGQAVSGWDFDALAPAGALRSTVDDLLTFLAANLEGRDGPLGQALRRAQEVHTGEGRSTRQGLGWQIEDDVISALPVHWHNGGTGGYRSFVGFVASHQVGVVLLGNRGDDDDLDAMGFELLRIAARVSLSPLRDGALEPPGAVSPPT